MRGVVITAAAAVAAVSLVSRTTAMSTAKMFLSRRHYSRLPSLTSSSSRYSSSRHFAAKITNPPRQLSERFPHPLDKNVNFDSASHKYSYSGSLLNCSVTEIINSFSVPFDGPKRALQMMNGPNWPRSEYMHENGVPFTLDEILQSWEENSRIQSTAGTQMHAQIEEYLNGQISLNLTDPSLTTEMSHFLQYFVEHIATAGLRPLRTEWPIAAPDLGIGGCVDFVAIDKDGYAVIMDWKRSNKVFMKRYYTVERLTHPLTHLEATPFVKYSLQLNLYRYILENYYRLPVSKCVIVVLHPDNESYQFAPVPDMQKEILSMLATLNHNGKLIPANPLNNNDESDTTNGFTIKSPPEEVRKSKPSKVGGWTAANPSYSN